MSAFSDKTFDANSYSTFRPTYPEGFYDAILRYQGNSPSARLGTLLDLGCGPGEGTLPLVKEVHDHIIATDVSPGMIQVARANFQKELDRVGSKAQLTVALSPSENLSAVIPENGTVDLAVAAECVHWFDWPRWLDEMARVIRPGGSLVYFAYCDPVFPGHPEADGLYEKVTYSDSAYIGKYWQQPGRARLQAMYRELNEVVAKDPRFTDVEVAYYDPSGKGELADPSGKLTVERSYTLGDFVRYVDTWSASHRWNELHKDTSAGHEFYKLIHKVTGWNEDKRLKTAWRTVRVFARRSTEN